MQPKDPTASDAAPTTSGKAPQTAPKRSATKPPAVATSAPPKPAPADGMRETVESVVVAFVLAFLFRTFEAEAFVIPTGSMAPTLMGRHKDIHCEKCQFPYRVTAKPEVDEDGNRISDRDRKPLIWMTSSLCPNCGYEMPLGSRTKEGDDPSYAGDRILVAKFPYDIGEPERWDVVVFKFPLRAHQNFIKRLVGLPNETVRILRGDIYVKGQDAAGFTIARKPPDKVQAMMQTVYDNDYALPETIEKGWPPRWQSWAVPVEQATATGFPETLPLTGKDEGWIASDDFRSFEYNGEKPDPVWLRYTHTLPSPEDWQNLQQDRPVKPHYQEILDYNAYNLGYTNQGGRPNSLPNYWCGDLALQCEVEVRGDSGELLLELVEGGVQFQCRIDVATGEARLSNTADSAFQPKPQPTNIKGQGVYRLAFANVDDQLLLWVDGKVIPFEAVYEPLGNISPLAADLAPVGIASQGLKIRVSHLRVQRDIYYIAARFHDQGNNPSGEDFPLAEDQFFVMGDNSSESLDARFWMENFGQDARYVHRDLMTGKALLIYWPHSFDRIPGTGVYFPFFPNFERMGYVR